MRLISAVSGVQIPPPLPYFCENHSGSAGFINPLLIYASSSGCASPVPIPATLLLFSSGLFGLIGIRKKINDSGIN